MTDGESQLSSSFLSPNSPEGDSDRVEQYETVTSTEVACVHLSVHSLNTHSCLILQLNINYTLKWLADHIWNRAACVLCALSPLSAQAYLLVALLCSCACSPPY